MREFVSKAAPALFVLLWSTGFIGAKLGLPYAEPFTFLSVRFFITLLILVPIALLFVRKLPPPVLLMHSAVTGVLVHGLYLGGVFLAISRGMPAGISALVVALQPLLTAFVARMLLGERLRTIQIAGLIGGLFGVALVLAPKLSGGLATQGLSGVNLVTVGLSVVGISVGTVYQKRFVSGLDMRIGNAAQYAGALVPLTLVALMSETRVIDWQPQFLFALGWLVIVLSIGAVGLLMYLIRMKSASGTASLFYLVPAVTSVMAWFLFDETLMPVQLLGMAVVMISVAAATRS
ncbi:MAG: DMT family transporter [Rhizobiaceae bacterium]